MENAILSVAAILFWLFVVVVLTVSYSKKHARQVAEADAKMKQFQIDLKERTALAKKQRLIQAEEERLQEEAKQRTWREKEKLPEDTPLFDVYNTGLYSTYQPDMTSSEVNLVDCLLLSFSPHCIFVDSYFRRPDGRTSQIDIIAVGRRGVFVFESKGYNGWIFGGGSSQKWTQMLAYGHEKHSFYNPIKQNQSHINILKQKLKDKSTPFFSIIVLGDNAEIKRMEYVPKGVFVITEHRLNDLLNDLRGEPEQLSITQIIEIGKTIKNQRISPQDNTREEHIAGIEDMLGTHRVYSSPAVAKSQNARPQYKTLPRYKDWDNNLFLSPTRTRRKTRRRSRRSVW